MTTVEDLRNAVTTEYEDVRSIFRQLRPGDLAKSTDGGAPMWRIAMDLALAPNREVRAARRIADEKAAAGSAFSPLTAIADWRRRRAFAKATRADFLTAWENGFNELFACINELAEAPPDGDGAQDTAARDAALEHLSDGIARLRADASALRRALGLPPSG